MLKYISISIFGVSSSIECNKLSDVPNIKFLTYLNRHYISWFLDPTKGFHIDDACVDSCSSVIDHSFCTQTTHTCQCKPSHNIIVEGGIDCVSGEYLKISFMYTGTIKSNSDINIFNLIS